jgi:S1-C subfamily serine protease
MNVVESRSRRGKRCGFGAAVVVAVLVLGTALAAGADEGGDLAGLRELGRGLGRIAEQAYPGVAVLRVEGRESAAERLRESLRRRGSGGGGGRSAVPEGDRVLRRERFEGEEFLELLPEREIRVERDQLEEELRKLQALRGERGTGPSGQRLGIIVSAEGYIVTNHHIVSDAKRIEVKLADGRSFTGKVVGLDQATDLAVLKIEATDLEPLSFSDSDGLELGDWVIGIGNPLGIGRTFSLGMVTGKHRRGLGMAAYEDYLQTSAAPSLGDGGGPLLDLDGKVVGMNTAVLGADRGAAIGLAIPANMVKGIYEELVEHGRVARGFLGIALGAFNAEKARVLGLEITTGVLVIEVVEDSAAARGGLEKDDVIVEMDGEAVASLWALRNRVARQRPETAVEIVVVRGGERKKLAVTLGHRPSR